MNTQEKSRAQSGSDGLSPEKRLHEIIQNVIRLGKAAGAQETEVHIEQTLDALTRFANNGIHQNVAEQDLSVSVRTVLDGKTSRVRTNRLDEDSLRATVESSLSLGQSQPKTAGLLPMPGKQRYPRVQRFMKATAALRAEDRARAVRKACDIAVKEGQVAAGIFVSGQMQSAIGNSRGLFATYRQTRSEFSITIQQDSATSWAKANAADVRILDPHALAERASGKARMATNAAELAPGKYTVILEPAAVLDLVGFLFYDFAATAVADKRSCLNGRIGKPLFGKNISVWTTRIIPANSGRRSTVKAFPASA
jgi:predicted Zn-dependent protease